MNEPIPLATEQARYIYDLTPDARVIDGGAYMGDFAAALVETYGCNVLCVEPIKAHVEILTKRFAVNPKGRVNILRGALGRNNRTEVMHLQNNSTGMFATAPETEVVRVLDVLQLLDMVGTDIALLKLNIEGQEYEVLERLLEPHTGGINRIVNLQVQFHTCAPDWEKRYEKIAAALAKTHRLTWRTPFVWENWTRL